MLDAHMDEVGLIITGIKDDGMLTFSCVGGINTEVLLAKRVKIGNVFGTKFKSKAELLGGIVLAIGPNGRCHYRGNVFDIGRHTT